MSSLQKFHRRTQPFVVNTLHTGTVSITGTAARDSILTATNNIADADGLGTFTYQWKRSGTVISGATASTYTLVSADVGYTITVTITYTDGKGFTETETSAATVTVVIPSPFPTLGSGSDTVGYWVGTAPSNGQKLITAPAATQSTGGLDWGSAGSMRGTTSLTNGLANTNTLAGIGQAAHPAAYFCKTLTTGGYNTWYMPAKMELLNTISAKTAGLVISSGGNFNGNYYKSSSEVDASNYWFVKMDTSNMKTEAYGKGTYCYVRAFRTTTV